MISYLASRLGQAAIVMLAMSAIVFVGIYAIGNPVYVLVDPRSPQHVIEEAIRNLGLDRPIWEQYLLFVARIFEGDLGTSFVHSRPAIEVILERMPATLELVFSGLIVAVVVGLPLGLAAGARPDSLFGRAVSSLSVIGFSLPTFWVALLLVIVFSIELRVLPSNGRGDLGSFLGFSSSIFTLDGLRHLVLPAITMSLFPAAVLIRLVRAGVAEHMRMDYVTFARAKGLHPARILFVYVLRNILIPVITVMGMLSGILIAFAIVTETVFAWPGMGKLIIDAIGMLDRPVVVAYLLITVAMFIVINLITDLLYSIVDPRVRLTSRGPA